MGCSSEIGLSHCLNLQNEAVLRGPSLNAILSKVQGFSGVTKSLHFLYNNNEKRQRLFLVGLSNHGVEPESGARLTAVSKKTHASSLGKDAKVLESGYVSKNSNGSDIDSGGEDFLDGDGGNGKFSGGGGNGGGSDNGENDNEEEEFGPLLKFEEVMRETEARGTNLPADMLEAAKSLGLRKVLLMRYLDLQVDNSPCLYMKVIWFYRLE